MQDIEEVYLRDLRRIQRRAKITLVQAGPYGSRLLDSYGPSEAKGRFSLMAGTLCFVTMFFVGLHSGLAGQEIVTWCLAAALAGGLLSVLIYPWKTYQQYLSAVLAKCSDDSRLAPLRETINRTDMTLDEKCQMILELATSEINDHKSNRKEN